MQVRAKPFGGILRRVRSLFCRHRGFVMLDVYDVLTVIEFHHEGVYLPHAKEFVHGKHGCPRCGKVWLGVMVEVRPLTDRERGLFRGPAA